MRLILRASVLSSIFLCAIAASANTIARADLPFSFVVKGQSFPAGSYDIIMDTTHGFITLASRTHPTDRIVFVLGPAEAATAPATLRFNVCGGRAFLRDIHMGVEITAEQDRRSKPGRSEACTDHESGSTVTARALDGTQMSAGR